MNIFLKKKIAVLTLVLALCVGGGFLATPQFAYAQDDPPTTATPPTDTQQTQQPPATSSKNVVTSIVGWIVVALVWTLGQIMVVLMYILLWVASYNDFINSPAVTNGWVILRDVCNMFFVLILLVIAFATVLNRENYAMKKLLPKFIIAAILINFSRLICGIIIDFAQVIMLTFVNGFRDIGGGNLADMLGISGYLSMSADSDQPLDTLTIVGTYILALLYSIIATVVVAIMVFVLVVRMVMIWIYVVLSPLPYLLSVLPATEKYASKWWDDFSKNVVSGPILAFFIWLSFASVQPDSTGASLINGATEPNKGANEEIKLKGFEKSGAGAPEAGISKSGSADSMLKFIISIGLLMGGLMITKELGGAVGSVAGAGFDKLKGAAKGVRNLATRPVRDRWQAFQGQREAARKEKISAFGDRMYSRYNTAKTAVKTAPKAWAQSAALGVKGTLPLAAQQKINAIGAGITNAKNAITFKNWRQNRENRKSLKDGRIGAYQTGVYKDASGKYDILHENDHGEMVYARTKKDKKGKEILKDGKVQYEFATDYRGENIGKLSEREYKVSNTWTKAMYKAKANSNQKEEKAINDEQKKMADAGLSPSQLAAMLEDSATNKNQKMAASLTLAIKAGFKDHAQIAKAEESFGIANNALLSKKFNDDVDKKQAYIHYDIDSEDEVKADKEMKKLQKRMIDKKLEVQDSAAYKNDRFIEATDNALTKDEFVRQMKQVSAHSLESDQALKVGHTKYLDRQAPVFDEDDNFAQARVVVKDITKDGHDAVRGNKGKGLDLGNISKAVKGQYDTMSYSDIAKQDIKTFDFNDDTVLKTAEQRAEYEAAHLESLEALGEKKLQNIIDDKNGNRKTQRRLKELHARIFGGGSSSSGSTPTSSGAAATTPSTGSPYSGGKGVGFQVNPTPTNPPPTNPALNPSTTASDEEDDDDETNDDETT